MSDNKPNQKPELQLQPVQQSTISMDDVINKLIPAVVAAQAQANRQPMQVTPALPTARVAPKMCHECRQQEKACGGKHIQMVVYPTKYPQHADYFMGAIINGVRYLSNDPGHKVTVPEIAEATILGIVAGYEDEEQAKAVGRAKSVNSGRVSPFGNQTVQQNVAWR